MNRPTAGVDQSDVYQMLAYERAYKAQRLVLLNPWHHGLVTTRVLHQRCVAEASTCFELATGDVGRPDSVRTDASGNRG